MIPCNSYNRYILQKRGTVQLIQHNQRGFQLLLLPFFSIKPHVAPNNPKAKATSKENEWGYELKLKPESSQFSVLRQTQRKSLYKRKKQVVITT